MGTSSKKARSMGPGLDRIPLVHLVESVLPHTIVLANLDLHNRNGRRYAAMRLRRAVRRILRAVPDAKDRTSSQRWLIERYRYLLNNTRV